MKLSLTFATRLLLLALLLVLGLILTGVMGMVLEKVSDNIVAVARITVVIQELMAFIVPAVALALMITRLPAEFLMIKHLPSGRSMLWAALTLIVAFPAIEWTAALCAQLPWPEDVMRLERKAAETVTLILGPATGTNFAVSILIMAVLTGLAEELFFRGALMRTLQSRPMSLHAAVWIAAVIFSLMHGQMVGFVPRALIGAYFGYVALWTGSLWTAVICHALNNTCALIALRFGIDVLPSPAIGVASIVIMAMCLYMLKKKL